MEEFKKALDEVIGSFIKLGEKWDMIEETHSDKLSEKYPFEKDFRGVISDMLEWKENLK